MTKKILKTANIFESFDKVVKIASGLEEHDRSDALRTSVKGTVIDTCCAPDTGTWETGIQKAGMEWVIVEQYETRTAAAKGHADWVAKIKKNPKLKLEDIDIFEIGRGDPCSSGLMN